MRSFTFCTLLLTLSACGGDKGDETTETATATTTATGTTTGTGSSTTGSESGTTADAPTTGGVQSSGEATASTGPGETGGTSTGGTSTTGSSSTGDTSTGDTTTSGTSTGGDSSSGTSTGGGTSELSIAIVDAELWANCQPEVEPDPVQGSWFVEFDNTGGAAATSAKVIKASLSLLDADPPVLEEIAVSPTDSGPIGAGEQTSLMVKKLKGAAHSGCDHCGAFYLLALDYQEGDVIHKVTEEVTISCAF